MKRAQTFALRLVQNWCACNWRWWLQWTSKRTTFIAKKCRRQWWKWNGLQKCTNRKYNGTIENETYRSKRMCAHIHLYASCDTVNLIKYHKTRLLFPHPFIPLLLSRLFLVSSSSFSSYFSIASFLKRFLLKSLFLIQVRFSPPCLRISMRRMAHMWLLIWHKKSTYARLNTRSIASLRTQAHVRHRAQWANEEWNKNRNTTRNNDSILLYYIKWIQDTHARKTIICENVAWTINILSGDPLKSNLIFHY